MWLKFTGSPVDPICKMAEVVTCTKLFDALLAGTPAREIELRLQDLPSDDRLAFLCTACYLLDEVKANSMQYAQEIGQLLERNCRFYLAGKRTCEELVPLDGESFVSENPKPSVHRTRRLYVRAQESNRLKRA